MCTSNSPVSRFIESMKIDYEKWHDGIGYDLEALAEANNEEREVIERILVEKPPKDWRDIEALAILDTPRARSALQGVIRSGRNEVNMAVLRFAPELVDDELKTKLIVESLRSASFFYGLYQTLYIVEKYHPKEVIKELFYGLLNRDGEVAVSYAAMLFYIYGKTESYFPFENRAFFLKFNTSKLSDRKIVFKELCEKISVDCTEYLRTR
jgi:hypothetical protein